MSFIRVLYITMGAFTFCGAFFRLSFFVNHRRYKQFEQLLGEFGVRWLYIIIGILLFLGGFARF